jgi:hypothetical protein
LPDLTIGPCQCGGGVAGASGSYGAAGSGGEAGGGGEAGTAGVSGAGGAGTLYCCALDLLCTQSPTIELAPCLTDIAILNTANAGVESDCKAMIDNRDLRVHKYDCALPQHADDCYFEEADALAQCQ